MKKIAVINDLSGLGKCSLTAAIPVISVMGVQACPLPTAVLSNQTGYESYYCDDFTYHMDAYMKEWKKRGFHPDGIYTGFLSDERQADQILSFLREFADNDTLILMDTVMGDQGEVYPVYSEGMRKRLMDLAGYAQVITPNLTEALLLLGNKDEMERQWKEFKTLPVEVFMGEIEKIGKTLEETYDLRAAVITGIDLPGSDGTLRMGNLIRENKETDWVIGIKTGGSYSGTGDLFASVLSAGLVKGFSMKGCAGKAVDFISAAISDAVKEGTDRNDGVCFERYLGKLL